MRGGEDGPLLSSISGHHGAVVSGPGCAHKRKDTGRMEEWKNEVKSCTRQAPSTRQTPSTREAPNSKLQEQDWSLFGDADLITSSRPAPRKLRWRLELGVSLELGTWSLELFNVRPLPNAANGRPLAMRRPKSDARRLWPNARVEHI